MATTKCQNIWGCMSELNTERNPLSHPLASKLAIYFMDQILSRVPLERNPELCRFYSSEALTLCAGRTRI